MYFWKHWGTPFWEGYDDFLPSALPNQGPFFPWRHQKQFTTERKELGMAAVATGMKEIVDIWVSNDLEKRLKSCGLSGI